MQTFLLIVIGQSNHFQDQDQYQCYWQPNHHFRSHSHLVEHLEGPVIDGNIGGTHEEGEDFGKRPNQHVRHLCAFLSLVYPGY